MPVDDVERQCPLCGDDNACGLAAGKSICWCFGAGIPAEVLERIPPERRGIACLCERCAAGGAAESQAG